MSASKLLTVLTASTGIASLVNDRIYLAPVESGTVRPFVAYEFESDDPVRDLNGVADLVRQDWNIYVSGDTFAQAETVKQAVLSTLNSETAEFYATFQNSSYNFDESTDNHQFELNFTLLYK